MKILIAILFIVFGTKLSVLLHEIGHAIIYIIFTSGDVKIYIGDVPSERIQFRFGRLSIGFNNWLLRNTGGVESSENIETKRKGLLLYIAGPLMNIILIAVMLLLYFNPNVIHSLAFGKYSILLLMMVNIYFLLFSLVPMKWHSGPMKGVKNDGTRILEYLNK